MSTVSRTFAGSLGFGSLLVFIVGFSACEPRKTVSELATTAIPSAPATGSARVERMKGNLVPVALPTAARPPGPLCGAALQRADRKLAPKTEPSLIAFPGQRPPKPMALGKWQWVNLWASWCKPCRKEIPLLLEWRERLQRSMDVVFFSVDDAARSVRKFLGEQPAQGLRATFWLKPGQMRKSWLDEAGLPETPLLPTHLLIDPTGRVRCVVSGAIDEADFLRVKAIVQGKK